MGFEDSYIRLSNKRDLNAFLILESLLPNKRKIVEGADHDVIYLGVTLEELAKTPITEKQIHDLVCSGIFIQDEYLSMFV